MPEVGVAKQLSSSLGTADALTRLTTGVVVKAGPAVLLGSGCSMMSAGSPFLLSCTWGDCFTLTSRSIAVQVTSKGQVTIPKEIRDRLGLLPHTKVAFELAGDHARIRKAEAGDSTRGRMALDALCGTADVRMKTDDIMALTRGNARPGKRRN